MCKYLTVLVFCLVTVSYAHANTFELVCPEDVVTDCLNPHENLNVFGRAYVKIYNDVQYINPTHVESNLNSCGVGIIKRYYHATFGGNSLSCIQTITVTGDVNFEHYISWPRDIDLIGCDPSIHPQSFSISYRQPLYYDGPCTDITMHYEDWEDYDYGENCRKIKRMWCLIDHCQYNENDPNPQGIYQYAQYIKVHLTEEPQINIPHDITLTTSQDCETAYINLSSVSIGENSCGDPYEVSHDSPYADQQGIDASGDYPIGTTRVTYEIPLECWNKVMEYSFKITVEKSQECIDQEYEQSQKQTNVSGHVYMYHNRDDIAGAQIFLESDAMDTTIQIAYDTMYVEMIVDSIQGRNGEITYVKETTMTVQEVEEMTFTAKAYDKVTNNDGEYIFEWLDDANYMAQVQLPEILDVSYTFADMGYLYDYLQGRITDVGPYFLLAADLDNSGDISNDDYQLMQQLFSGTTTSLPEEDRFILLPEDHVFINPSEPWGDANFESGITKEDMRYATDDMVTRNYVCIPRGKFGDTGTRSTPPSSKINIKAYPNPFTDRFTTQLDADRDEVVTMSIYDVNGRLIVKNIYQVHKGSNAIHIDEQFMPGIYFLEIDSEGRQWRQKVIKL